MKKRWFSNWKSSTALKRHNLIRNKNNQLQLLIGMWIKNQWQLAPKSPFQRSIYSSALVTGKSSVLKESQSNLLSELCFNHFLYIFILFSIMFSFVWVIAQLLNILPWYESANSKFKRWKENLNIQLLLLWPNTEYAKNKQLIICLKYILRVVHIEYFWIEYIILYLCPQLKLAILCLQSAYSEINVSNSTVEM